MEPECFASRSRADGYAQPEPVLLDETESAEARRAATEEYLAAGRLDRRGRFAGFAVDTLSVVACPSVAYYGWSGDDATPGRCWWPTPNSSRCWCCARKTT
ncbi:MAG TPA: hypothetical protein VG756_20675 [Pseudonocardiaceae bacterium]|nr:hypothetical protein [Pseudonocardiaceae bacterium]